MLDSGQNHQVVAYGYPYNQQTGNIEVYIYDNNIPLEEVTLTTGPRNPHINEYVASTGGLSISGEVFVHDYDSKAPPDLETSSPSGPFYVNRDLVRTSLNVKSGDSIKISSTGIVDFGGAVLGVGAPKLNANGDSAPTPQDYPAPNHRKNSLIIKIENKWY